MYEEEKKNSFIRDLIIKLLYFFLFLFLFMWLYPAPKVDLDEVEVNIEEKALEPLYQQVFTNNINSMKDAGKSYFTTDRLPSKTGDKVKITLKDMINKKLLLEFTDEEGKSCNENDSYVEVTKSKDSEYNMKVYLSCDSKKDYVNEIIGCNNVCPTGTCTNITANTTTKNTTGTTNRNSVSSNTNTNTKSGTTTNYVQVPNKNTTTTVYVPTNNNVEYVTVYFDSQGGTSVSAQTMTSGNTAYEPVTSRNDYTFKCWSTVANDTSCNNRYNFNSPVYSNKTLYAQWQLNNNVQYEYVKTVWEPDYTWTTEYKTGNDVKRINTKNSNDYDYTSKSYTYRTISWFRGSDYAWTYGLWINNIPADARNVRFTTEPTKFSSRSEIQAYKNNRYTCTIQMVGSGCPTPYDDAIIPNEEEMYHSVGSFGFNHTGLQKVGNKYRIYFNLYNYNVNGSNYQYLAPIKFVIKWEEPTYNYVTKYQYSYKRTYTKYSNSNYDSSLINDGYTLTGRTR